MDEDRAYIIFVLGYDLLHDKIYYSKEPECDISFDNCKNIAEDFLKSEFNVNTQGLYDCLVDYIKSDRHLKFLYPYETKENEETVGG